MAIKFRRHRQGSELILQTYALLISPGKKNVCDAFILYCFNPAAITSIIAREESWIISHLASLSYSVFPFFGLPGVHAWYIVLLVTA